MSNIEKIKAEIKRLKKILEESTYYLDNSQQALGYSFALDDLEEFIDSLPEETCKDSLQVPETCKENTDSFTSLEEAAEKCINDALFKWSYDDEDGIEQYVHDAFIAGAEWQKEQMMKGAVEGFIFQSEDYYPKELVAQYNGELKHGDKVKIIIVKQ